ncbi:hypothetical protein DFQ27_007387 [Actinomortierella ambigua]|uniref:Uncharacterized protein n=1 Tax=Actinomortierella ambigua TaxID=1343610 RepID=A0A9P6QKB1_9FUNG|nr:hypothetical protein DFQ27_007387 [Actinomortierella ambigua]
MIILRRALVLALAGLATLPGLHAQAPLSITFSDAEEVAVGTQGFVKETCTILDFDSATFAMAVTADEQAALNTYQDQFCQIQIASTVGGWLAEKVAGVVAIRWEGTAPAQYEHGYVNLTSAWPPGMRYQQEVTDRWVVDPEKGKQVVIIVSLVLVLGVALGAWKVYKAASYIKPPELIKKKKDAKDREYTGVVGNKKVKKKHAYYRKPAPGTLGGNDGGAEKQERYRDDEEEEEDRFDEYGRRMYKDVNGDWQVLERDSSDDTDSEEEERRKKAEKRRRRPQPGRGNGRRGSEDSNSSRDHDTSSAAANRALNSNGKSSGFLKIGSGGKRSSAGSSTLASHSPMATTTTFRQNQYTGVSGRASPQPVLIDMQETNYQQRRPLGAPAPSPSSSSFQTTPASGNTFSSPSVPPVPSTTPAPQPSTVMTYHLPPPAHTQIDLMRFDTSSPAPSGRSNNSYGGSYDPQQNPYQQRQQQSDVVVSMPQQYQNHHHPTSPTRRGGYSANQRF